MKIIRNNTIPFKGFAAVNLFGVLFIRGDTVVTSRMINHETVHTAQMREMLYVSFYLWYFVEWLVRLVQYRDFNKAYRNISFEREAYAGEGNALYLSRRKRYAWTGYLKKNC
ncbi:hypothetical protein [uncultured Phocaeicola sp.]|uniref:hypothetical protein n=1 Tax=uncultured Phocaeicola sp. TaxID=990718 RepID=UPI00259253FD|nr:hypothetical protein [uncultured Phocaeicola sp.]